MWPVLQLDLDVDAGRQIQLHQRINGLRGRIEDVDQSLVGTHLEVLATVLSLCGERMTQYTFFSVSSGTGPATFAPVRETVSTIVFAHLSMTSWS